MNKEEIVAQLKAPGWKHYVKTIEGHEVCRFLGKCRKTGNYRLRLLKDTKHGPDYISVTIEGKTWGATYPEAADTIIKWRAS